MKVTEFTRSSLRVRRQKRKLEALGYRQHETDWEIHRGFRRDERIVDVQISECGMYVFTLLGKKPDAG